MSHTRCEVRGTVSMCTTLSAKLGGAGHGRVIQSGFLEMASRSMEGWVLLHFFLQRVRNYTAGERKMVLE